MPIQNNILVAPVGFGDISQALGVASGDLGTLCTSGLINKWAKYKPFRSSRWGYSFDGTKSTPALRSPDRLTDLAAVNYGLDVVNEDGTTLVYSSIAGAFKQIWTYYPPIPGTHPLRALDFDGYHTVEVLPIQSLGDITVYRALVSGYNFTPAFNNSEEDVRLVDLTANALDGWYIGVAFAKNAGFTGTLMYKTTSTAIPSSGTPAFPTLNQSEINTLKSGGYTHYFMFATDTAKTSFDSTVPSALFRCLPRNSTSEMTGLFTISDRLADALSITKAAFTSSPSSSSLYADMSNYTGSGSAYYDIGVSYYLNIAVSITAMSDLAAVLTKSELSASLSATFAGGAPSGLTISTMRDSNYTSQNTITIPAGTTQTVYLTIGTNAVLAINAQGQVVTGVTPGQQKNIEISLYQRGANFATVNLRLRN